MESSGFQSLFNNISNPKSCQPRDPGRWSRCEHGGTFWGLKTLKKPAGWSHRKMVILCNFGWFVDGLWMVLDGLWMVYGWFMDGLWMVYGFWTSVVTMDVRISCQWHEVSDLWGVNIPLIYLAVGKNMSPPQKSRFWPCFGHVGHEASNYLGPKKLDPAQPGCTDWPRPFGPPGDPKGGSMSLLPPSTFEDLFPYRFPYRPQLDMDYHCTRNFGTWANGDGSAPIFYLIFGAIFTSM